MRVLIFHGYLLRGTGSNVYNAQLAAALARLGHEVHLLCQDHPRSPGRRRGTGTALRVRATGADVYRPDIGVCCRSTWPTATRASRPSPSPSSPRRSSSTTSPPTSPPCARWPSACGPTSALANHLVMGPAILARGLGGGVPYAVKIHGSALEYTVKPHPERFLPVRPRGAGAARAACSSARGTPRRACGRRWATRHCPSAPGSGRRASTSRSSVRARASEAAAGLDAPGRAGCAAAAAAARSGALVRAATTREAARALARVDASAQRPPGRLRGQADRLQGRRPAAGRLAAGARSACPTRRLVVVGFGAYRDGLRALLAALAAGDLDAARALAEAGRAPRAARAAPLRHARWRSSTAWRRTRRARALPGGRRGHGRARRPHRAPRARRAGRRCCRPARRWSSRARSPRPSAWWPPRRPRAGRCRSSAEHSGPGRGQRGARRPARRPRRRAWLSFPRRHRAVEDLAERVVGLAGRARPTCATRTRTALVAAARERCSWEGVATGVIAAAQGRLGDLPSPLTDRVPTRIERSRRPHLPPPAGAASPSSRAPRRWPGSPAARPSRATPDLVNGKKLFVEQVRVAATSSPAPAPRGRPARTSTRPSIARCTDGFAPRRDPRRGRQADPLSQPSTGVMPAKLVTGQRRLRRRRVRRRRRRPDGQGHGRRWPPPSGGAAEAAGPGQERRAGDPGRSQRPAALRLQERRRRRRVRWTSSCPTSRHASTTSPSRATASTPRARSGANGDVSEFKVNLKPGKYTFLCTVPGHAQAGMKGTLTVK